MTAAPVISIVTPSYNQGHFLASTIESVISQQGDFLIDYIVMDGASSDDSPQIIRHYERLLQQGSWPVGCLGIRFRWLSEQDRGQTDALVKGFALAQGEILAWLNSDDTYLPGALQSAADFLAGNPDLALVYGEADYCNAEGASVGRYRVEDFDYQKLAYRHYICQPSTFFTREAYQAAGGLDPALHYAMDYDLFVRIARRFDCRRLPSCLATYRLHDDSKTMRDEVLFHYHEETLRLALKYFDWAPLNVVYGSSYYLCRARLPGFLAASKPLLIGASLICALVRSLKMNRGVRVRELRLLTRANFKNIFKERIDILTG